MLGGGYDDGRVSSKSLWVSLCFFDFMSSNLYVFPMMLVSCYALDEKGNYEMLVWEESMFMCL